MHRPSGAPAGVEDLSRAPLAHYAQRALKLGFVGTVQRAKSRAVRALVLSGKSFWWRLVSRRELTDRALLTHTTGDWRTIDALLEHLANRSGSSFLLPYESSALAASLFQQDYPQYCSAIVSAADAACNGEFNLLGIQVNYGAHIDWHKDPLTGWRWPVSYRERLDRNIWSPDSPADLILTLELNRHQHFALLGAAYWLTAESRYVVTFAEQVQGWIDANPLQHGVHWYFSLEMAVRLIAWTVAFQFFRGAPLFQRRVGSIFLKSLYQQADFVSKHLQTARTTVTNNHLIAEATALALVGAVFPEFREASVWRDKGLQLLEEHIPLQTHADGVNREQATCYHRFVTELLLLVVVQGRRGLLPRSLGLEDTLAKMLDYVLYTLTPVGTAPLLGDSDYARALGMRPNENYWHWRPLLAAGAALFSRADWKFGAGRFDEEAFWILGPVGLDAWGRLDEHLPEKVSHAFPDSGLYILRDDWTSESDVGFFRCGPFGLGGEGHCVHAHCDLLSIALWIHGKELLVDSGTYFYSGPQRNAFRLTAAHNCLMVDGHEQAKPRYPFNWSSVPHAECLASDERHVAGSMSTASGVKHRRDIVHPAKGVWQITDFLEAEGLHDLLWSFHFAPGLALRSKDGEGSWLVELDGQPYVRVAVPKDTQVHSNKSWYSAQYGRKVPNPLLESTWRGQIPVGGVSFVWEFRYIGQEG